MIKASSVFSLAWLISFSVSAGEVSIVDAKAQKHGSKWSFSVTLKHDDSGWDHYADQWRILNSDDEILGVRVLHHPHVNEQPFTRSLSGVELPQGTKQVFIEARDSVHGWSPNRYKVVIP
ncbi:hypothetical protein DV711_11180 [Motiliproteus coralliicola]|uniref:Uncharacterized protein n=1 Tax=Motiliproteus coralliicola TaxID=2283196 RepID=A0A369WFL3_9GAMM|nr:hypothetical protein [Motiliproteus coralliicola]RDE19959.1 hypothetical protein DV711_11180 [Motiliproteus coralliicola]